MENESKKNGNGIVIALLAAVLVLVAAVGVLSVFLMKSDKENKKELARMSSEMEAVRASAAELEKQSKTAPDNTELNDAVKELQEFSELVREMLAEEEEEDIAEEDDVPIGGGYIIRSTKAISDAYKSGNTTGLYEDEKKCLELAKEVLDSVIEDGMDEYEKEKAVYEWIRTNVKHAENVTVAIPVGPRSVDTPYGVLTNHRAVCVGYATTFRLLMQMLDYDCKVVHDTGLSHSWDLVKLGDHYYHVDLYFQNFNMNDDEASESHDWNREFFPAADGFEYCYTYKISEKFTDIDSVAKKMYETINSGKTADFAILLEGDDAFSNYCLLDSMAAHVDEYITSSDLTDQGYSERRLADYGDSMVFYFRFVVWNNGEEDDPTQREGYPSDEKISQALNVVDNAFANFYNEHVRQYW